MDTQPIFDFLHELETRSLYVHPVIVDGDDENARLNKFADAYADYLVKLKKMKSNLEAIFAQLVLENPSVKTEFGSIADRLNSIIEQYRSRKQYSVLSALFTDDQKAALLIGEETRSSLERSYGAIFGLKMVESEGKQEDEPVKNRTETAFMSGKDVASFFGLAYNNVKDKAWRIRNKFPYHQPSGDNGKVVYVKEEVDAWVKQNGNRN